MIGRDPPAHLAASTPTSVGAAQSARRGALAPAPGPSDVGPQLAWQREMELAQMTSWFKVGANLHDAMASRRHDASSKARNADGGHARAAPGTPRPGQSPACVAPGMTGTTTRATTFASEALRINISVGTQGARTAAYPSAGSLSSIRAPTLAARPVNDALAFHSQGVRATVATSTAQRLDGGGDGPFPELDLPVRLEAMRPSLATGASCAPHAPHAQLHLHAESTPSGQAVWIAMRADLDTQAAMLAPLVTEIRRAAIDRAQPLHQIVCNGRLVWRSDVAQEQDGDGDGAAPLAPSGNRRDGVPEHLYQKEA